MSEISSIKFSSKSHPFGIELRKRVRSYFLENNLSTYGNFSYYVKITLLLIGFIVSYGLVLSNVIPLWSRYLSGCIFGIISVLIVFNISHDAGHHAISKNKKLNQILVYTLNLLGTNAYLWNITHNKIHHSFPNVANVDCDIHQQAPLIRVSPSVPFKKFHKYQVYYAPILYLTYSLFLTLLKDFQDIQLLPKKDSILLTKKHKKKEYLILFISKLFYITYFFIIPILIVPIPWWKTLLAILSVHILMSFVLSIVLIPVHMVNEASFAFVDDNNKIDNDWINHVFANTIDYARKSKLANIFFGGLNTHLVHHLFPKICHIHYIDLSEILMDTAAEYNISYNSFSFKEAIVSHFRLLRRFSHP